MKNKIKLQAHRGVKTEYPENTLVAFMAAAEQGYSIIECDPKYTFDGEIVFMHDSTLNRCARKSNGEKIETPLNMKDITFEEARAYDFGMWKDEKFKGEKCPTLQEVLDFARETGISLKIDNVWETFPEEVIERMFNIIAEYSETAPIGLTFTKLQLLERAVNILPYIEIHYDGGVYTEENLNAVAKLSKGHRLVIWVAFGGDEQSWFKGEVATEELCEKVKAYGELGLWKLSQYEQLEKAVNVFHADIVETDGQLKPHMC